MKGKVKKTVGRLTGNRRMEAEGRVQSAAGRMQRKLGEAERDMEKDLE